MNVLLLKSLALSSMIIDHYGAIFQNNILIFRIIGRLAFPIYCFLLVEGYFHTRDAKKYGFRLLIFAFISELPFDLAFYNKIEFSHQNIFFTLFIGLAAIYFLENKEKYKVNNSIVFLASGILSIFLFVDYSIIGIIYILGFYYTRNYEKSKRTVYMALIMFVTNLLSGSLTQQYAILALPVLYFYNGELGPKNKLQQILFYTAYPLHLAIYYFIKTIIHSI